MVLNRIVSGRIAGFVVHLCHHEEDEFLIVVSVANEHERDHHIWSKAGLWRLKMIISCYFFDLTFDCMATITIIMLRFCCSQDVSLQSRITRGSIMLKLLLNPC